ncbi:MAG TPA: hypothetical protein VGI10_06215 [Polyangiaceae bacterium]|jgi:hypothetical protein
MSNPIEAIPIVCACGQERSAGDRSLNVHVSGVLLMGPDARWLKTCRWCGAVYVIPERFRPPVTT